MEEYTNDLIKETSPYLLQHAHNPVNWVAWSDDVFERAKAENKLVLISIGYSSCHWCHVMEKESFEDEEVTALMNKFFINIKVDREERPDIDQIYMTAVQLMTNRGGWPLNCFTLPDGRPIYGGTYFQKEQWMHVLRSLNHTFHNERQKVESYAENLLSGIANSELIDRPAGEKKFEESKLEELVMRWSKSFDHKMGGGTRAPKFPLPNNLEFLLDYGMQRNDDQLLKYVETTLDNMAMGGIYDQIGGGFARYSVDMLWKVPHFEKMLYDNGQLISIYSQAFKKYQKPLYKHVVYQTINWLTREMADKNGAFYAALDADSEGEEGRYYIWSEGELKKILQKDYQWVSKLYSVNSRGYWENENYILLRSESDVQFAAQMGWTIDELYSNINRVNEELLSHRETRVRPGLDSKLLTGWNAMILKGLCEAYKAFEDDEFLTLAIKNARWISSRTENNGKVWRSEKSASQMIPGFLEDYAHVIDAFISLAEITGDGSWFNKALSITDYTIEHFRNNESKMFYYADSDSKLITRKMELSDNVIPSGNSVMARNLYYLGRIFDRQDLRSDASQMLANIYDGMEMHGSGYSNWAILLEHEVYSMYELVCVGPERKKMAQELQALAMPKSLIVYSDDSMSELPLFDGRISDENKIYVCIDGACLTPVSSVTEAYNDVIQ